MSGIKYLLKGMMPQLTLLNKQISILKKPPLVRLPGWNYLGTQNHG
jgi:hypothetical protein